MQVKLGNLDRIYEFLAHPPSEDWEEWKEQGNIDEMGVRYSAAPLPSPMDFVAGVFKRKGGFFSIEGLVCSPKSGSFSGISDRFGMMIEYDRKLIWMPTKRNGEGYVLRKGNQSYIPVISILASQDDTMRIFNYGSGGAELINFFSGDEAVSFEEFRGRAYFFEKYFNMFVNCSIFKNGRESRKRANFNFPICLSV